ARQHPRAFRVPGGRLALQRRHRYGHEVDAAIAARRVEILPVGEVSWRTLMSNFGLGQRQDFMQPAPTMQPPPSSRPQAPAPTPGTQRSVAVLGPTLRFKGELSAE